MLLSEFTNALTFRKKNLIIWVYYVDILVISEDVDNAEFIKRLLKLWFPSVSISVAITSDNSLEGVSINTPSLVLTEKHMSGANGLEIARRLQGRFGSNVKVVIITNENSNLIPNGIADGVLQRPFSIDCLYHLVNVLKRTLLKDEM